MVDWITDPQAWMALATLTVIYAVLSIDNIIFISMRHDPFGKPSGGHLDS
jgi:predicted tellurium resistance membrane protein TerC